MVNFLVALLLFSAGSLVTWAIMSMLGGTKVVTICKNCIRTNQQHNEVALERAILRDEHAELKDALAAMTEQKDLLLERAAKQKETLTAIGLILQEGRP